MPKCTFCSRQYEVPRGVTVVSPEGHISYYCSSKCRKNKELGRDKKFVNWIRKKKETEKEEKADLLEAEDEKKEKEAEKKIDEGKAEEKIEEKPAEKKETKK